MLRPWMISVIFSATLFIGLLGAVTVAFWSAIFAMEAENPFTKSAAAFYRNAIPPEVRTAELVGYGSTSTCDGFAFRLAEDTAKKIEQEGLGKLQLARTSLKYNDGETISYRMWQPTPVPKDWRGDGRWSFGIPCFVSNDESFNSRTVDDAIEVAGGFYTSSEKIELVILLKQRIVAGAHLRR